MQDESTHIDLQNLPTYTREWGGKTINVYGYDVELPIEPPDNMCVNFGLPQNDQYFRRTLIPEELRYWDTKEKEAFISQEHHRRREGLWYLINGQKFYIPGVFYYFLNYWKLQTGKPILYRMSDLDFFLIWMHVVRSPYIFGLVSFKCRRIGDTEKAICIVYEYASRVKNTLNGMQDCRKEDEIELTYGRITYAHENMIWFMKPVNRGSNSPKGSLELKYPDTKESVQKIQKKALGNATEQEIEFEYAALNSEIRYYVSTPDATDGKRHGRYYCDEFGKPKKLNPIDGWRFTKKSLVDEITEEICGKSLYTSTIEQEPGTKAQEMSKFLDIAQEVWDDANPDNLNENGETTSGMIRIVRGALERGKPNRFGYTDKERLREKIEREKKHLIANRKWKQLIEHGRQNCITVEDIFANMSGDSNFNVENLAARAFRLQYEPGLNKAVRGNFHWVDGKKFGKVYWQPNDNGRWLVSGHPKDWGLKENARSTYSIRPKPQNIHAFCCGIDPVSQKDVLDKDPSKAGLVIKRKFDPAYDANLFDEKGIPFKGGEDFKTNRYVCTYLWRWNEPTRNYEDWLMTLIYYGSDFLIEKNHSAGFQTYLESEEVKHDGYYMANNKGLKNYNNQTESWGMSANEKTIEHYFGLLATVTNLWSNTLHHIDLIDQLKSTNYENRGKRDLSVAAGICEVAALVTVSTPKDKTEDDNMHFEEIYI